MYINLQKVARRKSMSKEYDARKFKRAIAMRNVQRDKALRLLNNLASVRLNAGDERHSMSSFVLSFTELERTCLFRTVKDVNELTEEKKLRFSQFVSMFKTYPENCEWTAELGVVCISFRFYDAPCTPLCYRIKPKKSYDTFNISGPLLIMDRLCKFLSRPYAMALCMALFSNGGCCDTLFM